MGFPPLEPCQEGIDIICTSVPRTRLAGALPPQEAAATSKAMAAGAEGGKKGSAKIPASLQADLDPAVAEALRSMFTSSEPDDWQRGDEMMREALGLRGPPDKHTFNSVIHSHSLTGNVLMAELWLSWMAILGKEPSSVSYACVINACAQAGDVTRAEGWLAKSFAAEAVPNKFSFNAVIHACAKAGLMIRAEQWLSALIGEDLFSPDVVSYNTVIHAYARTGNVDRAEFWLQQMVKANLVPNEVTMGSLINACAEAGKLNRAERILEAMTEDHHLKPNDICYNAVIKACVNCRSFQRAEVWMLRMRREGFALTPMTYNLFIHGCAQASPRLLLPLDAVRHAGRGGGRPDPRRQIP